MGSDLCSSLVTCFPNMTQMCLPVGMAVDAGWRAVGGPSGVCNTSVRIEDLGKIWLLSCNELLQLDHLANLLECKNFILLVTVYRKTGRVIATVFEAGETVDEGVENVFAVLLDQVIDAVCISIVPRWLSQITH